jgi:hypothetical protein
VPHDVVISYSRRNREIAEQLTGLLRERGLDVWYDRMIKPGADWRDEIANAISHARIFLILFSSESNESQELRKELAIADRRKLLIVPVRIEEVEPTGLFEYELARRQWFDIFADWRAGLPAVVDFVAEAAQSVATATPRDSAERDQTAPSEKVNPPTPRPRKAHPPKSAVTRVVAGRGRAAFWTAAIAAACGISFAVSALILLIASGDNEMPGGVATVFLVPGFLLAQLPAAAFAAADYGRSRAINWLLRGLALWTVGVTVFVFAADGARGAIALAQVGGVIAALVCLAFVGLAARDGAPARSWILPLVGSGMMTLAWIGMDGDDFTFVCALIAGLGLSVAGAGYVGIARSHANSSLQAVAVPAD